MIEKLKILLSINLKYVTDGKTILLNMTEMYELFSHFESGWHAGTAMSVKQNLRSSGIIP